VKVMVVKARRMPHAVGWLEGINESGNEVAFILPWFRVRGIAEDVNAGEKVEVSVPYHSIVHVKNPRMRRAA